MATNSPSPASVANAGAAQQHVNSIMRPIQTHVRVLGYPEFFHYSRDRILTLSKLKNSSAAASTSSKTKGVDTSLTTGMAGGGSLVPPSENPLDRSNIVCEAKITNLHPYGQSTDKFFEVAVAPCIESALSGQSFVFLVTGPGRSGRSQTVYGDNAKMKGLVELTAERLLQQIGEGDYLSRGNTNTNAASSSPSPTPKAAMNNNNALFSASSSFTNNALAPTVTYSCFGCSGNAVFETTTNEPVELREFPAPLGVIPLPKMSLLEIPRHAVCIPKNKNASYFTQFQIVKPVVDGAAAGGGGGTQTPASSPSSNAAQAQLSANGRRCVQSTITFIDLVQIVNAGANGDVSPAAAPQFNPDLAALIHAVNASSTGADPQFNRCALTRLLEQSIVGSTTMIPIATVTGLTDFFPDTTATLKFVEAFGNINQVLSLVNIIIPSWLKTAYEDFRCNESENDAQLTASFQRGVFEAYIAVTNVLGGEEAMKRKETAVFDGIAAKVAELRSGTYKSVQEESDKVAALLQAEKQEADLAESRILRDPNFLQNQQFVNNCEEDIRRHEALIQQIRSETESTILHCKNQIAACNERTAKRDREVAEYEETERTLKKAIVQRSAALARRAEDVAAGYLVDCHVDWIESQQEEIQQLDTYVTEGSKRARDATNAERTDRELRAHLMKLTQMERQAEELRAKLEVAQQQQQQQQQEQSLSRANSQRSATPQTVRGHGVPAPATSSSSSTANGAFQRTATRTAPAVPTSRYGTTTSVRQSSASVSPSQSPSKAAAAGGASPFSRAMTMTTNTIHSVSSILGGKSKASSTSKQPAIAGSSAHHRSLVQQANGRASPSSASVRITNCINTNGPEAAMRGTVLGSTSCGGGGVPPLPPRSGPPATFSSSRSAYERSETVPSAQPLRHQNGPLSASTRLVNQHASSPSSMRKAVGSSSYTGSTLYQQPGAALKKMIVPTDEEDDSANAYSTTFIASP